MTNGDILSLFLEETNPNKLGIRIENGDKNIHTTYKLHLMDIIEEECELPATEFNSVVTMQSIEFQKYIRDMYNIADVIEIRSIGQQLVLSCKGEFASQHTVIGGVRSYDSQGGEEAMSSNTQEPTEIVQGIFSLKYLTMFTKCTQLSQQIELYLKNDFPLICRYTVASMGSVSLALVPQDGFA
jgi:proliferating cell nuclear antigen